jgi:site-specific DNA recombinase
MVSCQKCGYAFSRTSTQTSARKIHYYKCIGSDSWRKLGGPVCDNGRFVRQDLLDQIVWAEVIKLLEDPTLIQQELDRRLAAARSSDPTKKREQSLQRELVHVGKGIERLLGAYQEALMSIDELRERMPGLRQREQALRAELQAIADQANDQAAFLRLAENLTAFLSRLRGAADTLSITERQRIVRLVVKDVLIGDDTITIRHSISVPQQPTPQGSNLSPSETAGRNYLLCKGSERAALRCAFRAHTRYPAFHQPRLKIAPDRLQHPFIPNLARHPRHQHVVVHTVEELLQIEIDDPPLAFRNVAPRRLHGLMGVASGTEALTRRGKLRIEQRLQNPIERLLKQTVQHRWYAQCANPALRLGYLHFAYRLRLILARQQVLPYPHPVPLKPWLELRDRESIDSRRSFVLHHAFIGLEQVAAFHYGFHRS